MKKLAFVVVLVAVFAAMAAFAAPAMAVEPGALPSIITSYKWYDANADGIDDWPDPSEPGIPGWKIELLSEGAVIQTVYTDAEGWYTFAPVMPGTYIVREGNGGCCWLQTWPFDPGYYTVVVTGDGALFRCQTPFGNVCRRFVGGFTPGFWGNKNGLKALQGATSLPTYGSINTAAEWNAYFRAGSTAVNMCDKLMWHYWAYYMNVNVKGINYEGAKIFIGGELVDFDISEYAGCTGDRSVDEFWKNIFDGLNNGKGFKYLPYGECRLPKW